MRILYCNCSGRDLVPNSTRQEVLRALGRSSAEVTIVQDLCELAARRDTRLRALASGGDLAILACHPRAVRWLFKAGEAPLSPERVRFVNMRDAAVDDVLRQAGLAKAEPGSEDEVPLPPPREGDWEPWFPVIDRDRCVDCRQCLSFCLFGVYDLTPEGTVAVADPESCKNNCPACARICPEVAIMFPKLDEAPIDGAPVTEENMASGRVRVNMDEMLGAGMDLRARLSTRRRMAARKFLRTDADSGVPPDGGDPRPAD
jgi:NAD-dependent dihydropyrimidine dehydrogenase PreA subunit